MICDVATNRLHRHRYVLLMTFLLEVINCLHERCTNFQALQ